MTNKPTTGMSEDEQRIKWVQIFERLRFWRNKDQSWQSAINEFVKVIAPKEFPPMINSDFASAFIDGIAKDDQSLKNSLEYMLYEVPYMKDAICAFEGNSWDLKKDEEALDYFCKFHKL